MADSMSVRKDCDKSAEYETTAVQAIDDLLADFGGHWPPRPVFDDWPASWRPFQQIADDMPFVCHELKDALEFRKIVEQQLREKVTLSEVLYDLKHQGRSDNPAFLALLAPISVLVCLYRWGTIPPSQSERQRTQLNFPKQLWTPFEKIHEFWGTTPCLNVFGILSCNMLYKDPEDPNTPTNIRFCLNYIPEMVRYETNFLLVAAHSESSFLPALGHIREYLAATEVARRSRSNAERLLNKRIDLLSAIRKILIQEMQIFRGNINEDLVNSKHWVEYVEAMLAWRINGVDRGPGGDELFFIHITDAFLGISGQSELFQGTVEKRQYLPRQYRKVLNALQKNGGKGRFRSFLGEPIESDGIVRAKDMILGAVHRWRLGHAKTAGSYLETTEMTSGGRIEKLTTPNETIAERAMTELRRRAQETVACVETGRPGSIRKTAQNHLTRYKINLYQCSMLYPTAVAIILFTVFYLY